MKIADLGKCLELKDQRDIVESKIAAAERSGALFIQLDRTYQDDRMVNAVRPHVIAHLKSILESIDQKLSEMGVELPK